jgi:para-nitrobenzyl esterase
MRWYQAAVLAAAIGGACAALLPDTDSLSGEIHRVSTTSGVASGTEQSPGVLLWQDIPFSQPPIGELRWRAPRPLEPTEADIPAQEATTACLQRPSGTAGLSGEGIQGSEDCLYLDVRSPATAASEPRPVMVWIHGGGNTSGYKGYYDFSELIRRQDVVVVTLNYRLGAMGWFTHPAIQDGQTGLDRASNFGTLDIIQGLRWVGDNIRAFGGDPQNITIFGESAGGHNVLALLASPLAEGLFHKAISQSGYARSASLTDAYNESASNPRVVRSSWQLVDGLVQQALLGAPTNEVTGADLRSVPGKKLLDSYYQLPSAGYIPLTTTDNVVIPQPGILGALANPDYAKRIPVIAGANRDELTLWLGVHRYFVDAQYLFTRWLPPRMSIRQPDLFRFWVDVRSRAWKLRGVDQPLTAMQAAGYPALYAYRFDWRGQEDSFFADFPELIGAAHGTDISFVTGDFRYGPIGGYIYPEGPDRDQLQNSMMNAWAEFARTGNPGTVGEVSWNPYTAAHRPYLHLDTDANLRVSLESQSFTQLLEDVAATVLLNNLEQCLLAWETLTKVGEPDYQRYKAWNEGQCANIDADREQARIDAELVEEHGSATIL